MLSYIPRSRNIASILVCSVLVACGGGSSPAPAPANLPPTANAGADRVVDKNATVTLSGSATDPDGRIASVRWSQLRGPSVILNGSDSASSYFLAPSVTSETTLEFMMTVTDDDGAIASDSIVVLVQPDAWESGVPLPHPRWGLAACAANAKIYTFGGVDHATLTEEFDIATQTWTTKASMPVPRYISHACATVGGKIYVMGGIPDEWGLAMGNVDVYDPATDTWSTQPAMPTPRSDLAAAVVNGKIYAIGGRNSTLSNTMNTVEEFDPATGAWTAKAPLPVGRHTPMAANVGGWLYVVGGFSDGYSSAAYLYDHYTDSWRQLASMQAGRVSHSATEWHGKLYVFGGETGTPANFAVTSAESYDPVTDRWTRKTDMPNARERHGHHRRRLDLSVGWADLHRVHTAGTGICRHLQSSAGSLARLRRLRNSTALQTPRKGSTSSSIRTARLSKREWVSQGGERS
ncbi:Kelch repeat-containing protein [Steroidobacter cummioxidans]|uniref:Kelch repeat-containing protein n=1 Tax=Steroidobacter cummioxidans TaxID=1803913 RepID=UPI000E3216F5|nr:kelch repeat-containing protein [Steroidobacter cummioxidans]